MISEKKRYLNELSKIGKEILELKNKQELDNTLWTFNTQVCNASIYAIRKELQSYQRAKIEMEMEVPKDKIISFSDIEDFEDETSIFEEFDKAIAEYEDDLLTNQSLQEQVSL